MTDGYGHAKSKLHKFQKTGLKNIEELVTITKAETHKVTFKGNLNYKVVGFKSTYKIDHTEELKLSL